MTLTIDKKEIDFTLDNEKYLKEVIQNINNWLNENQLIIEKLYINNQDYSSHDLNIELKDIHIIDIETLSFTELNINNLSWIKYFFERLINAINEWDMEILKQVKNEVPFVINHLPIILSPDNKIPQYLYSEKLTEFLEIYNYFICKEEVVNKKELTDFLETIVVVLTERLHEYTDAKKELISSIDILYNLKDDLESVSIYLQSGKEKEARVIMGKFTEIFNKILRIINFNLKNFELKDGENIQEFTEGLDDILNELLEGYESQDTVLIGDILEYELSPRIETLKNTFS